MLWIFKTGAPWRDLPDYYGPWKTAYNNFLRWPDAGVWERVLENLNAEPERPWQIMIDSTIVKAHQHSAGNRNDICEAPFLLDGLELVGCYVLADKGYDSVDFVERIEGALGTAVIPSRRTNRVQRMYDKEQYKSRNQVERFFNRMKQYRRFATRYEKTAKSFISLVHFVAVFVFLALSRL